MSNELMDNNPDPSPVDSSLLVQLSRSQIEQQVTTAHKFPRSIVKFRREAQQMVTLNEQVAGECVYALPRGGKTLEGPSARFAEIVASAWGNCHAGARVISDEGEFVIAQGVFHDLERNVSITIEVPRRITDKNGRRFNTDMIGVTGNAATSIALRNAILKGVPKAFWSDMYEAARQTIMGDFKTLHNRRADALKAFQAYGVSPAQIYAQLGIAGEEDITLENLLTLRGFMTAIKDGDSTPEQIFTESAAPPVAMPQARSARQPAQQPAQPAAQPAAAAAADPAQPAAQPERNATAQAMRENPPPTSGMPADDSPDRPLTESEIDFVKSKMEEDALGSADLFKRFEKRLDAMTAAELPAVLAWLKNPAA